MTSPSTVDCKRTQPGYNWTVFGMFSTPIIVTHNPCGVKVGINCFSAHIKVQNTNPRLMDDPESLKLIENLARESIGDRTKNKYFTIDHIMEHGVIPASTVDHKTTTFIVNYKYPAGQIWKNGLVRLVGPHRHWPHCDDFVERMKAVGNEFDLDTSYITQIRIVPSDATNDKKQS